MTTRTAFCNLLTTKNFSVVYDRPTGSSSVQDAGATNAAAALGGAYPRGAASNIPTTGGYPTEQHYRSMMPPSQGTASVQVHARIRLLYECL